MISDWDWSSHFQSLPSHPEEPHVDEFPVSEKKDLQSLSLDWSSHLLQMLPENMQTSWGSRCQYTWRTTASVSAQSFSSRLVGRHSSSVLKNLSFHHLILSFLPYLSMLVQLTYPSIMFSICHCGVFLIHYVYTLSYWTF